jgi:PRC-barrel domain protein
MRRHSRWTVAAVAAALALTLVSSADGRTHRRTHARAHPTTNTTKPPQMPASGMRSNDEAVVPRTELASVGKGGTSAMAFEAADVEAVLGKSVRSSAGEDMGRLVDVVVDRGGRPRAAIIDFGGFLGVGSRKIAVDWGALKFARDEAKGDLITVELTRDQLKAAPEFKEGSPVVVLGPSAPQPTQAPKPQAQEK